MAFDISSHVWRDSDMVEKSKLTSQACIFNNVDLLITYQEFKALKGRRSVKTENMKYNRSKSFPWQLSRPWSSWPSQAPSARCSSSSPAPCLSFATGPPSGSPCSTSSSSSMSWCLCDDDDVLLICRNINNIYAIAIGRVKRALQKMHPPQIVPIYIQINCSHTLSPQNNTFSCCLLPKNIQLRCSSSSWSIF